MAMALSRVVSDMPVSAGAAAAASYNYLGGSRDIILKVSQSLLYLS